MYRDYIRETLGDRRPQSEVGSHSSGTLRGALLEVLSIMLRISPVIRSRSRSLSSTLRRPSIGFFHRKRWWSKGTRGLIEDSFLSGCRHGLSRLPRPSRSIRLLMLPLNRTISFPFVSCRTKLTGVLSKCIRSPCFDLSIFSASVDCAHLPGSVCD